MRQRFEFLDGLRGIAALIVVFHHAIIHFTFGLYSGQPQDSKFPWDIALSGKSFLLFFAGNFSVAVFFLLSGFVLSHVFLRTTSGPIALIVKRYVRLTVPITAANIFSYALCVVALALPAMSHYMLIGPGFDGSLTNWFPALVACLTEALLHATITGFSGGTYNGVLWTMQMEFVGSIGLIAIFCIARAVTDTQKKALNVATLLAMLWLLLEWQSNLALFSMGVAFYRIAYAGMDSRRWKEVVGIPLFIAGIYLGCMPEAPGRDEFMNGLLRITGMGLDEMARHSIIAGALSDPGKYWVPFPFLPVTLWHGAGAALLVGGVLLSGRLRHVFEGRVFRFLGLISFSLYLTHGIIKPIICQPVYDAVVGAGYTPTTGLLAAIAVFVPVALLVATVFTELVEWRSIRWSEQLASKFRRRRATQPGESAVSTL